MTMKARQRMLLMAAFLLLLPVFAAAEEKKAEPINASLDLDWKETRFCTYPERLYDDKYKTGIDLKKTITGEIRWEEEDGAYLVWWAFTSVPERYSMTFFDKDGNTLEESVHYKGGERGYAYVPEGAAGVRFTSEGKGRLTEWQVYAKDAVPDDLLLWEEAPEKCDILFVLAHADDEHVMMGGIIPTYAAERGYTVQVVYCYVPELNRHGEALNGLAYSGMKTLPVFLPLSQDELSSHKYHFAEKLTELIRRYKPEVVITHDPEGEYGNPGHTLVNKNTREAVEFAATEGKFPDSEAEYGLWEVKKLYFHLYPENQIKLDFDTPLEAFDGKTAYELAQEAYGFHKSQKASWLDVLKSDKYDCRLYGLVQSTVGEDVAKNDFLENIPAESLSVKGE